MIRLRPCEHTFTKSCVFLLAVAASVLPSCVNNAYDLNDISLKMTLGADGITLPLGKFEALTVDSLVRKNDIKDLVVENGSYAYKLDSTIRETIDAISIDPVRDVIPSIDPYYFQFSDAALPESFQVAGTSNRETVALPSLDFSGQQLAGFTVSKPISVGHLTGTVLPEGTNVSLPSIDETDDFAFIVENIPHEITAVRNLWFGGSDYGTPIRVHFELGALASAVKEGAISFELTLPDSYSFRLVDTYGGKAAIGNGTLRLTDYPVAANRVDFVFYLAERSVREPISASRKLEIGDDIRYSFYYTGISNGTRIPSGGQPLFSLDIAPTVSDAEVVTDRIVPEPTTSVFDVPLEVDGLDAISRVEYVAFTEDASNVLVLHTSHSEIPLQGEVPVRIEFPETFLFAGNVDGLEGHVLNTTLDRLSAGSGITLQLAGVRFEGDEAVVTDGVLSAHKQVTALVSPDFPANTYKLSEIDASGDVVIDIDIRDMDLRIDTERCVMEAGFRQEIDIRQEIAETFDVPDEVAAINFAEVLDADSGAAASALVSVRFEDMPIQNFYFDQIDIALPAFLEVDDPNYNPATHTVHIDRVEYTGGKTDIARITVLGIKDVPVRETSAGKLAELMGEVRITATILVPDGTDMEGVPAQQITLRPEVALSPLDVTHMTGEVDIDLQEYLEPTTIDLSDIRESLGEQNIEVNLVAPQISLVVSNPVGIAMVGDIVLQPYDFSDKKLDPVVVKNVRVEPAEKDRARITKLFVTDGTAVPEGYTLCRVEDLSDIVKIIPSKIDVTFDLKVDDQQAQNFSITGEDYPFDIDYSIRIPLEFKSGGSIDYTDTEDIKDTFSDITDYEITADDVLIQLNGRSTLPLALDLSADFLDQNGNLLTDVKAIVLGRMEGYNSTAGGAFSESQIDIRLDLKDGNVQLLNKVSKIRYHFTGEAVGSGAALAPDQYVEAEMKLILKKGITFDLEDVFSDKEDK